MHHAYWRECIAIARWKGDAISCTPQSLLLQSVFISKLFPGHFGSTRNNSKCFVQSGFLSEPMAKVVQICQRAKQFGIFFQ
jgi:hypothetical protein